MFQPNYEDKLDYVLNIFKKNKMDMQMSTLRALTPEYIKPELMEILKHLQEKGFLTNQNEWWSGTIKGRSFSGFANGVKNFKV